MNVSEVADWVGMSDSTIRKYVNEFGDIEGSFSEQATPDKGQHRRFTTRDVGVVYWISRQYSDKRMTTDEVQAALKARLKDDTPFELPPRPDDGPQMALIPREQHEAILREKQEALDFARNQLEAYKDMLDEAQARADRLQDQHKEEVGEMKMRIAFLKSEIRKLAGNINIDDEMLRDMGMMDTDGE